MVRAQEVESETGKLAIDLLVCVHTYNTLINQQGCVVALEEGPSRSKDALQSSPYVT